MFDIPGQTGKDTAKTGGNSASFSTGVHSTFKHFPTSSLFALYTLYFTYSKSLELEKDGSMAKLAELYKTSRDIELVEYNSRENKVEVDDR